MAHSLSNLAAVAACLAISACAASPQRAVSQENLLTAAGFTALPATTPERIAFLRRLPPNRVVQRNRGGTARYVYADPVVCACLYVGDQAAYGRYSQEVIQRRLADKQAMTASIESSGNQEGGIPWEGFEGSIE